MLGPRLFCGKIAKAIYKHNYKIFTPQFCERSIGSGEPLTGAYRNRSG
jgi:hypothetical protein